MHIDKHYLALLANASCAAYMHTHTHYSHTYVHMYIYIYIHTYTYAYRQTLPGIFGIRQNTHITLNTYVQVYIRVMHTCKCTYTYIYIYTYIYAHTHMHVDKHTWHFWHSLKHTYYSHAYVQVFHTHIRVIHTCICKYIYIYTHTCISTNIPGIFGECLL